MTIESDPLRAVVTKEGKKKLRTVRNIELAIGKNLTHYAGQVIKKAKRNATGGIVGKYKWGRATGKLGRNIGHTLKLQVHKYYLTIGTGIGPGKAGVVYARILEKGGVIRPKRAKYLAVPMPDGSIRLCKKVKIPKFKWFSKSVSSERPLLTKLMSKKELLKTAGRLTSSPVISLLPIIEKEYF